jgi:hypothetical protein
MQGRANGFLTEIKELTDLAGFKPQPFTPHEHLARLRGQTPEARLHHRHHLTLRLLAVQLLPGKQPQPPHDFLRHRTDASSGSSDDSSSAALTWTRRFWRGERYKSVILFFRMAMAQVLREASPRCSSPCSNIAISVAWTRSSACAEESTGCSAKTPDDSQ